MATRFSGARLAIGLFILTWAVAPTLAEGTTEPEAWHRYWHVPPGHVVELVLTDIQATYQIGADEDEPTLTVVGQDVDLYLRHVWLAPSDEAPYVGPGDEPSETSIQNFPLYALPDDVGDHDFCLETGGAAEFCLATSEIRYDFHKGFADDLSVQNEDMLFVARGAGCIHLVGPAAPDGITLPRDDLIAPGPFLPGGSC